MATMAHGAFVAIAMGLQSMRFARRLGTSTGPATRTTVVEAAAECQDSQWQIRKVADGDIILIKLDLV